MLLLHKRNPHAANTYAWRHLWDVLLEKSGSRNCTAFQISHELLNLFSSLLFITFIPIASLFGGTLPSLTAALQFLAQRRWPLCLPNPPSVAIVFVGHGDFASGRLVKAWLDYWAVWWMEGRPQTPFTWEQKPESGWIEGLSICLSLKKLKNFLQRLTNPPLLLCSLSLLLSSFFSTPFFPPCCLSCFSSTPSSSPLSIALSFLSNPPSLPTSFFPLSFISDHPICHSGSLRLSHVWCLASFRLSLDSPAFSRGPHLNFDLIVDTTPGDINVFPLFILLLLLIMRLIPYMRMTHAQ